MALGGCNETISKLDRLCALRFTLSGYAADLQPITAPVCETPPQLDADLRDPAWHQALKLTGFRLVRGDQPPEAQTTVWLCAQSVG